MSRFLLLKVLNPRHPRPGPTHTVTGAPVTPNAGALTGSGSFTNGAVGDLQPDKSGMPGVFFDLDENRDARGVPRVDPYRTSCIVAR